MMLYQANSLPRPCRRLVSCVAAIVAAFMGAITASAQSVSAPLTVTTLAGLAGVRQVTNGTGSAARFYAPAGIILNSSGSLIVADTCNNVFRQVTTAGVVTTFSGSPINPNNNPINIGSTDGSATQAKFHIGDYASSGGTYGTPIYTTIGAVTLGLDGSGNVYFADTMNDTIRKIAPDGSVTTVAGSAGSQGSVDGTAANARFNVPTGVAVDSAGNVYVADSGNDTIRKIATDGTVTTIAGTARAFGSTDGTGTAARFTNPAGIAVDAAGNLYVTDSGNHTIRKITPAGVVTTLAGKAGAKGTADGSGSTARFNSPEGIAVDSAGNIYVADTENHAIRKVSPSGTVTTIAGSIGTSGSADGTGNAAQFDEPYGIAVDSTGNVYVADTSNDTIRLGTAATSSSSLDVTGVPPAVIQTTATSNVTFKVVATGSPAPTYQWQKNGAAISGATSATYMLSNVSSTDAANYSVVVSSGTLTYTSAPTQLQVFAQGTAVPSVTIVTQPTDRTVNAGQSASFTVEASSANPLTYQWSKDGAVITGATSSTYTVSSAQTADAGSYTVAVSDGSSTATTGGASLTVLGSTPATLPTFTTQPAAQTVLVGGNVTFTAAASGSPTPTYQWQKDGTNLADGAAVSGATTATLTLSNLTTTAAGNYTVVATNSAGSTLSNAATLTVNTSTPPPPSGPSAWLTNVSVRTTMTPGQLPLIVGLTVSGGSKNILVRAAGPALQTIIPSLTTFMADPSIQVYSGSTVVASNDNWDASLKPVAISVGAFPFVSGSNDAALEQSMNGGYTIQEPANGGGIVLVEAYDTNQSASSPRLINVSARNEVGTGDNILIAGFAIHGTGTKQLLIRGVGPGLAQYGVTDFLADPMIQVYDSNNTMVAENNDWDSTLSTTFKSVGAFALTPGSKDAAMIVTLQAGTAYTVECKGADGGTGQALIEVYELP